MRTRSRYHQHLARPDLFAECTAHQIDAIGRFGTEIVVPAGTPVWRENRTEAQFVIVLEGRIDLTRAGEPVATLGAGTWFGHDALLNGRRTEVVSGTVTTPTRLLAFSRREFTALLYVAPPVGAALRAVSTQHHDPVVTVGTSSVPRAHSRWTRRNPINKPALTAGGVR